MKRRKFGLLAGTGLAALKFGNAAAQSAPDAGSLSTTLTPVGAERAGSADGGIPAWTGGYTTAPAGWQPGKYYLDPFANEQPVVVINAANMAQYDDKLSEGVKAMMQKFGFSIKVYPTHRTAAAPQFVYDNIAKNLGTATLDPAGGRLGFSGAYGGIPFPVPDASDPDKAGVQIIWNHICRWSGYAYKLTNSSYAVSSGNVNLAYAESSQYYYPYYSKNGSLATFNGVLEQQSYGPYYGPPNLVGEEVIAWYSTNSRLTPDRVWQLLNGQGRVRKAPDMMYDTPSSFSNGISNFDEIYAFDGSPQKYDWKLLGKKDMYIPYNGNGMYLLAPEPVHLAHFLDPNVIRWELHRCWVVEATLHSGERNVLARRRILVDEDTWTIGVADAWDANNNLYKIDIIYNQLIWDLPGVVYGNSTTHNLQTGDYASIDGGWNQKASPPGIVFVESIDPSVFDPQNMAASGAY